MTGQSPTDPGIASEIETRLWQTTSDSTRQEESSSFELDAQRDEGEAANSSV
jgi:hypothetical protein